MFLLYVVLCLFLVVSTSAIDCLERLVSEMTYYVEWDVKPYTLTHSLTHLSLYVRAYWLPTRVALALVSSHWTCDPRLTNTILNLTITLCLCLV